MNSIPFCKHTNRTSEVCETELEGDGQERSPETRPALGVYKASPLSSDRVGINTINVTVPCNGPLP